MESAIFHNEHWINSDNYQYDEKYKNNDANKKNCKLPPRCQLTFFSKDSVKLRNKSLESWNFSSKATTSAPKNTEMLTCEHQLSISNRSSILQTTSKEKTANFKKLKYFEINAIEINKKQQALNKAYKKTLQQVTL